MGLNIWYQVALFGVIGGWVGEVLDVRASLSSYHQPPWKRKHGRTNALGFGYWSLLAFINLALGGLAAVVVYGLDRVAGLSFHEIVVLAGAGMSGPAVLQKFGGGLRK